jgi:hypothetical protein
MPGEKNEVIVLIPVYRQQLSDTEKKSFERTLTVLNKYPIAIIKPESLAVQLPELLAGEPHQKAIEIISFDDTCFDSTRSYNRLLLSKEFYKRFLAYQYMLVCQLDVFLFNDDLPYWLDKGYDYIGAPWPETEEAEYLKAAKKGGHRFWFSIMQTVNRHLFNKKDYTIGNGGLSLRNVKRSLFIIKIFGRWFKKYKLNEDIFWSISAPLLFPFFRVPDLKNGLGFAFEKSPAFFFKMNKEQLPFGCHAWEKYEPEFWDKYIIQKEFSPPPANTF